jgi:hypothetical protein
VLGQLGACEARRLDLAALNLVTRHVPDVGALRRNHACFWANAARAPRARITAASSGLVRSSRLHNAAPAARRRPRSGSISIPTRSCCTADAADLIQIEHTLRQFLNVKGQ